MESRLPLIVAAIRADTTLALEHARLLVWLMEQAYALHAGKTTDNER